MTHADPTPPPRLVAFLEEHQIDAEFLTPGVPTPTVPAAAAAIGVPESQILKTLLFTGDGAYVVAIANGTRRVNRERLAQMASVPRLRAADPATVLAVTGYPAGGVSPIGLPADLPVIVDSGVAALPVAYGGGGREELLLRLKPADIIRLNDALVAAIVEEG